MISFWISVVPPKMDILGSHLHRYGQGDRPG
jgi:hypothetical protein